MSKKQKKQKKQKGSATKAFGSFLLQILLIAAISAVLAVIACMISYGTVPWEQASIYALSSFAVLMAARLFYAITSRAKGVVFVFFNVLSIAGSFALLFGLALYGVMFSDFRFENMSWRRIFATFYTSELYYLIVFMLFLLFGALYIFVMGKNDLREFFGRGGLHGKGKLAQVEANMENSRWMTDKERDSIFMPCRYSDLATMKKDGVPIRALAEGNNMSVVFNSPCHSLIIGSTGSGKTTTFINPMIQLLGASGAGSSMIITDPKGELFSLHSKFLADRGYDVKVLDLRDAYHSYRWNPLEPLWDAYREYAEAEDLAFERNDNVEESGLKITGKREEYGEEWYEFLGKAYPTIEKLIVDLKIYRTQKFDEMYEDMNDLVSVLVPVANQNDPMWEKGARAITMGVLLAMLEDSEIPELHMTKEKFNLFNMSKILQQSEDEYRELRNYFQGRSPLSKAVASAKQVLDAPDKTRSSYMSVLLEKLSIFNDTGICALTATSDFKTSDLAERPTALFLKIPDEKDTRHGLASIFLTNVYKSLIKVASSFEDLSLPRNVYYILDEFGNMPKIEKFDKMITVGRSRKIWFHMVVQSYIQLNNVYGDTVADIVKGNCGIKMFIGSNDMGTCKEFSELCGNITIVTQGSSYTGKESNYSQSLQTRPLIYPSELQKLNNKTTTGNSIVVTFGNHPLKTKFTPSYKVSLYKIGMMNLEDLEGRLFDESAVYYDISLRNDMIFSGGLETEAELAVSAEMLEETAPAEEGMPREGRKAPAPHAEAAERATEAEALTSSADPLSETGNDSDAEAPSADEIRRLIHAAHHLLEAEQTETNQVLLGEITDLLAELSHAAPHGDAANEAAATVEAEAVEGKEAENTDTDETKTDETEEESHA